ncbi:winged helix-turn-helix transcriptional regulator [Anaeromicrobium sediminis]|nr:helix-turn-helix domain-containing protein [Anaeromicrobium sediminis]
MNKDLLKMGCSVGIANVVMQGKWKFAIIHFLSEDTMRFGELCRALPNIRQGYLTQQLRELEKDGLVHREVYKQVPPKVEYSLTEIGREFLSVTKAMDEWGKKYIKLLEKTFDGKDE